MAEELEQEIKVEPDDPEYHLEEHVLFKHRQEAVTVQLKRLIQQNLSEFRLIMDGSTFAYTRLVLSNRGLLTINEQIAEYPHLRIIDLSSNQISETMHVQKLQFVSQLNLSRNVINDARFLSKPGGFPYLKDINLANNKLIRLPSILLANLERINLNGNLIASLEEFDGHAKLEIIELRGNKISSLKGLEKAVSLRELYLADNSISSLKGLANLPKLQRLHVRKNKFVNLIQFPKISSIKYLNLRENQIAKVADLSGISQSVTVLNLLANPVSEELGENTKKEVWMKYRNYQKINKSEVLPEEKDEFDKEYKERLAEQERQERQAREQAEQAEREIAEKEKNNE